MFKSRIVERMAFSAEGLTAGLKPQNIELSRDFLIQRMFPVLAGRLSGFIVVIQ